MLFGIFFAAEISILSEFRMFYKILSDVILILHLAWILFILGGFFLTIKGFFKKGFFDRWLFRTFHLLGIFYVSFLSVTGEPCPLTVWENAFRARHDPCLVYPGSFIVYYLERFVYPDIPLAWIQIPTVAISFFTILVFILRPPTKIKKIFTR